VFALQLALSGFAQGAIYALVALSLCLVYRSTTVVNFGHGDLVMAGAFVVYLMVVLAGAPFLISAFLAIVLLFALGVLIELGLIERIKAGPHIGFAFDHVISVQQAGYFKPHWKAYAKAEEILGEDRSSILFVANHAFDCIGAKSYGMRTAFIDRRKRPFGQTPHQPDLVVADFAELAATLA